jgi:hypothetical protein
MTAGLHQFHTERFNPSSRTFTCDGQHPRETMLDQHRRFEIDCKCLTKPNRPLVLHCLVKNLFGHGQAFISRHVFDGGTETLGRQGCKTGWMETGDAGLRSQANTDRGVLATSPIARQRAKSSSVETRIRVCSRDSAGAPPREVPPEQGCQPLPTSLEDCQKRESV